MNASHTTHADRIYLDGYDITVFRAMMLRNPDVDQLSSLGRVACDLDLTDVRL